MLDKDFLPFALDSNGAGKIKEITQNRRDTTSRKIATGGLTKQFQNLSIGNIPKQRGQQNRSNPVYCWLLKDKEFSKKVENTRYN